MSPVTLFSTDIGATAIIVLWHKETRHIYHATN
jgi:hypothetical protein